MHPPLAAASATDETRSPPADSGRAVEPVPAALDGSLFARRALLVANLAIALIALTRQWGYYEILVTYWCEALVIGFWSALKIAAVGLLKRSATVVGRVQIEGMRGVTLLVVLPVFIFKFGAFALTTGVFVALVPAVMKHLADGDQGGAELGEVVRALGDVGPGLTAAALALTLSHGTSFVWNFLRRREYEHASIALLVFQPYVRMAATHGVLLAGFVLAALLQPLAASTTYALLVVACKIIVDLLSHRFAHRAQT